MLRNILKAQGEVVKEEVVVEKPSVFNRFLNLVATQLIQMQVTPGYYAEKGKEGEVAQQGEERKNHPEDSMCTICFSNDSNCIVMDCKHGGICKECSIDMLKKSPFCPFCRTQVEKICVVKHTGDGNIEVIEEIHKPSVKNNKATSHVSPNADFL